MSQVLQYGIHPHVIKEYDLEISEIDQIRSVIKVNTQLGEYALKKMNISANQIMRMNEVIQYLRNHSFDVPEIIPNKYGDFFVPMEDGMVYMTKWIDGNPVVLNHQPHLIAMVKGMATMHKLGFSYTPTLSDYHYLKEETIQKAWNKRIDWLQKYKKKLKRKTSLTAFEHVFLSYLPFIQEWALEAVDQLNLWIIGNGSFDHLRKTITHGRIHHRNVMFSDDKRITILDLQHVSLDTPIRDVTSFIRKYILNKEHRRWAEQWLTSYEKIVPLKKEEKHLMAIYLLFPERLISLVQSYEEKKKDWPDDVYLEKLQVRWGQMKEMLWFIDQNQWLN